MEQRESEGLDTAKPALLSGEEESKPAASPESTSDPETESEPANIDEPKPMAPKKIESSNNNVDRSCANVESAKPFQLDILKVTNETASSRVEQKES